MGTRAAEGIFREKRELMPNIVAKEKIKLFGDIAYNYCPFIHAMPSVFPQSKLIVIYRDGRDFVRSAYIADQNDKAPVGWGDSVEKNDVNKFISLGRLRPQNSDDENSRWQSMSIVAKNAWLWAETNKIIFEGLKKWPREQVLLIKFETLFASIEDEYCKIREFLGITVPLSGKTKTLLNKRINNRKKYVLPEWDAWPNELKNDFLYEADDMMKKLGYNL